MFPSPVGELHFSISDYELQYSCYDTFPSPVGELHFSIMPKIPVLIILCFRPLSGNYISQFFVLSPMGKLGQGFRPLSGNYISQSDIHELYYYKYKRFRPLSGNYISQSQHLFSNLTKVSVPCRGTTFLN